MWAKTKAFPRGSVSGRTGEGARCAESFVGSDAVVFSGGDEAGGDRCAGAAGTAVGEEVSHRAVRLLGLGVGLKGRQNVPGPAAPGRCVRIPVESAGGLDVQPVEDEEVEPLDGQVYEGAEVGGHFLVRVVGRFLTGDAIWARSRAR